MPIADVYPSAIKAVTIFGRAVTRGDNSRVCEYSYTRVLPDGFLLKAIVFTVCEHDYMNIPPPPTPISRLVTALLSGNALFEFSMKRREILKPEVAGRYKSLCRDSQPITTWLFGDELPKSIRDIAQAKRMSVKQFCDKRKFDGPSASTEKRFNSDSGSLNFKRLRTRIDLGEAVVGITVHSRA